MNADLTAYREFLARKVPCAERVGFEPLSPRHESLLPHQGDLAEWCARGGRRAVFASFGLGKTRMDLQVAKWVVEHAAAEYHPVDQEMGLEPGKFLIIAPLGVRQEFTREEGPAMGLDVVYCATDADVAAAESDIVITNYERVRDGAITISPERFAGVGLDEASVLRSFGSKTYQTFLDLFREIPYRFVFTATPSPNRYKELIHYAAFLGVMDSGEALTRFFRRDSEKAGNLTLYPHMEEQFWHWVASWAVFIQRPSDLGYSDEGYDLPEMAVHWHMVDVDHSQAWSQMDNRGQAALFLDQSSGLKEVAEVKRKTMVTRLRKACEIIGGEWTAGDPEMEAQITAAQKLLRNGATVTTSQVQRALKIGYTRACEILRTLEERGVIAPPTAESGGAREVVNAQLELSSRDRHWIVWHELEDERRLIERMLPEAKTVYGTQDLEAREDLILGFARGEYRILATKPKIAGSGCNFQRHCADAIFVGSTYKFNDFIQAVHRVQRFQQSRPVNIHVIFAESEAPVIESLKKKWRQHDELVAKMTAILRRHRLTLDDSMKLTRDLGCERIEATGTRFRAIRNDCVEEAATWPENCVDQIVTSIPFGNQYEYSPSYNDFGHNPDNGAFFEQMRHLVPHLHRVLRPGRLACIHVKDRIRFGSVTGLGMPTVDRFSDQTATIFEEAGFAFTGRITIDTDVVRENAQTYRLGWSENAKDSTKMGVGMPEYVLLLRKLPSDLSNSYADLPVNKDKALYTRAQWQLDAAGFWKSGGNRLLDPEYLASLDHDQIIRVWKAHCRTHGYNYAEHVEIGRELEARGALPASFMLFAPVSLQPDIWSDIARMRVLNSEQGKRHQENHVCPLQLDIIERLINRYSNPDEIVWDPFGGIMSVPHMAIKMGRIGWGTELSLDYWKCGVGYCEQAEMEHSVPTLFDLFDAEPTARAAAVA